MPYQLTRKNAIPTGILAPGVLRARLYGQALIPLLPYEASINP